MGGKSTPTGTTNRRRRTPPISRVAIVAVDIMDTSDVFPPIINVLVIQALRRTSGRWVTRSRFV